MLEQLSLVLQKNY